VSKVSIILLRYSEGFVYFHTFCLLCDQNYCMLHYRLSFIYMLLFVIGWVLLELNWWSNYCMI